MRCATVCVWWKYDWRLVGMAVAVVAEVAGVAVVAGLVKVVKAVEVAGIDCASGSGGVAES